ncbi:MAG: SDR family oxidoreductase [bacterium]|nr:SDR family oxidoreductase [bacterium]
MNDKIILITGASSGIGAELARQVSRLGAKCVLAARDRNALEQVARDCPGALIVPTDVTNPDDCKRLVEQAIAHFGRIDVLVNNAGVSQWALFEQITDLTIFEQIMRVNYLGSVYCTYYALPHIKRTKGLLVAVSSLTGKTGVPTRTAYSASKHAMQGFFDSLRIELLGTGVDVLVVSPGFVQTSVRERAFGADGKPLGQSHLDEAGVMPVEECVRQIVDAMQKRRRELVMTSRGRLAQWLKLIAPAMVDKIALRAIREGKT